MKKIIIAIVLGFTALFATSCTDIYEEAYQAEMLYKAKKESPEMVRGSLDEYQAKFMAIYESMTREEQKLYKRRRAAWNRKATKDYEAMKRAQFEAIEMLNN